MTAVMDYGDCRTQDSRLFIHHGSPTQQAETKEIYFSQWADHSILIPTRFNSEGGLSAADARDMNMQPNSS